MEKVFLYEELATQLAAKIEEQIWQLGDKLPSVRQLSKERGLSASTVFQAYYQLEAQGMIESRDRSGYYVCYRPVPELTVSEKREKKPDWHLVSTLEMIKDLEGIANREDLLSLSRAVVPPELLPFARLSKCVQEAMRKERETLLSYAPPAGHRGLRRMIAAQLLNWGKGIHPEQLVITHGAMEALSISLQAVCQRGEMIAMDEWTYFGIHQLVESLGLKVVPIPQRRGEGLDLTFLAQTLRIFPIRACLFVPTFHNPTGQSLSQQGKQQLVQLMQQYQIPLIEDDVYGSLYFGKQADLPCKYYDTDGWVIYLSSFSKTLVPGFRVGYCVPGRFYEQVLHQKRVHSHSNSSLPQAALAQFLAKGRYTVYLRTLRKQLHTQMLRYAQWIHTYFPEEIQFQLPQGGLVFWIGLPDGVEAIALFHAAKSIGIAISPGPIFSANQGARNFIRMSFAAPLSPEIEQGLKVLGKLVQSMTSN